jgi:predicted RNase H-like HicB family nuclease
VVEVEFQRGVRGQRVEVVAHAATPPRTLIGALPLLPAMSTGREIRLIEEDDGGWSAIDEELNVASQGETREEALANLDEAVELTKEARDADTDAPEPDAPWFEG